MLFKLLQMEKLLVTSNFSFYNNDSKNAKNRLWVFRIKLPEYIELNTSNKDRKGVFIIQLFLVIKNKLRNLPDF